MTEFSPPLAQALRVGGWFPGRQIDTTEMVHALERAGYMVSEGVRSFLTEFGGVCLDQMDRYGELVRFDAILAAEDDIEDVLQSYPEAEPSHPDTFSGLAGCTKRDSNHEC